MNAFLLIDQDLLILNFKKLQISIVFKRYFLKKESLYPFKTARSEIGYLPNCKNRQKSENARAFEFLDAFLTLHSKGLKTQSQLPTKGSLNIFFESK